MTAQCLLGRDKGQLFVMSGPHPPLGVRQGGHQGDSVPGIVLWPRESFQSSHRISVTLEIWNNYILMFNSLEGLSAWHFVTKMKPMTDNHVGDVFTKMHTQLPALVDDKLSTCQIQDSSGRQVFSIFSFSKICTGYSWTFIFVGALHINSEYSLIYLTELDLEYADQSLKSMYISRLGFLMEIIHNSLPCLMIRPTQRNMRRKQQSIFSSTTQLAVRSVKEPLILTINNH